MTSSVQRTAAARSADFWVRTLADYPAEPALPRFERAPRVDVPSTVGLDAVASAGLRRLAPSAGGRLIALLMATVVVARRVHQRDDVVVRTRAAGRDRVVLLRPSLDGRVVVREGLERLRRHVGAAIEHADLDLEAIHEALERRADVGLRDAGRIGCLLEAIHGDAGLDGADLWFVARDDETLEVRTRPGACDRSVARWLLDAVASVLAALPEHLGAPIASLAVGTGDQLEALAALGRGPAWPTGPVEDLATRLLARVDEGPDVGAVLDASGLTSRARLLAGARALAADLLADGLAPGDRVALLFDPSLAGLTAILAVVLAGGVYVPLHPGEPRARLEAIVAVARPIVLLAPDGEAMAAELGVPVRRVGLDALAERGVDEAAFVPVRRGLDDPVYVMFTSGTTRAPKGTVVSQGGVLRLVDDSIVDWGEHTRILATGPLGFDASTFELWVGLLRGATVCFADRADLLDPAALGERLRRWRVHGMWLTAPLFHRLAATQPDIFAPLRHLLVGGSAVSPSACARVVDACPSLRITNGYGPTESTTFTTTYRVEGRWTEGVPIGSPVAGTQIEVVGIDDAPVPLGVPGEVWICGRGLALGYLDARERERDDPVLGSGFVRRRGERAYRAGDFVRWRPDGLLEFLGRQDGLLKIRGFRVQLESVELAIAELPGVDEAAVTCAKTRRGEPELVAYVAGSLDVDAVRRALAERLPDHMIPATIQRVEAMPTTTAGKVDRAALDRLPRAHRRQPRDPLERAAARIMARVLELDAVGRGDDFFDLGGHSMRAVELLALVHRELGVKLGLQRFLAASTPAALAEAIRESDPSPYEDIAPAPAAERDPLSVSQRRLVAVYDRDPSNTAFNVSARSRIAAPFDEGAARSALEALTRRHTALRTVFARDADGEWTQRVASELTAACDVHDEPGEPVDAQGLDALADRQAARVLDLESGPPHHVTFVPTSTGFEVLWVVHHIVTDGWSMHVLQRDFERLYARAQPEPAPLQLRDYVIWHTQLLADPERARRGREYWRATLEGAARLELPQASTTHDETQIGLRSAGYRCSLSAGTAESLGRVARAHATSMFAVLLTGFVALLRELSGQDDVVTAVPSANRNHAELEGVVGFLVDSVIIRVHAPAGEGFTDLLERVSSRAMSALDHAYYPIELACEAVGTRWETVLSNFFNLSTFGDAKRRPIADRGPRHLERVQTAKMPLILYLTEHSDGVAIEANYYRERFDPETVEGFMRRYVELLEEAAA